MPRRVLIVEADAELSPQLQRGLTDLDPAIEIDRAMSVNAAVDRLSAVGYDLIVSEEQIDGTRAGPFLRHLCERRFPTVPFVLLSSAEPFCADAFRQRVAHLLD